MYCKLCGEHLYKTITFVNLFRWNYHIHDTCEAKHELKEEFITLPMRDQLVEYDYLFSQGYPSSDGDYLFTNYMGEWLRKVLKRNDWSILIFLDDKYDEGDLSLAVSLGSGTVILLAMFDEEILDNTSQK